MTARREVPDILGQERKRLDVLDDVLSGRPQLSQAQQILLDKIRTDGGTQMRAQLDDGTVFEYTQAMVAANGWGTFPAVVAYYDGSVYWLGDGFHRVQAYRDAFPASSDGIPVEVRSGTRRDAILHAAGANASHGLRRSNADKKRAVETLLRDNEWMGWSDQEIARRCNVSPTFVGSVRKSSLSTVDSEKPAAAAQQPAERTYTTKHGTQATMKTSSIGKKPSLSTVDSEPPAVSPEQRQYESAVQTITVPLSAPATAARPTRPHTTVAMPEDLARRGWEMRELASLNRWYCHNANGPRATQPYDHPGDAIKAAYGMQVDLRSEPVSVAQLAADSDLEMARERVASAIADLQVAKDLLSGGHPKTAAQLKWYAETLGAIISHEVLQ
jgi:hypothetical protein